MTEGVNAPPQAQGKVPLASISSSLHLPSPSLSPGRVPGPRAHRGAVRGPGDEEPLVALGVLAVQAVQDVAGLLLIQQGQHEGVIVSVPAPRQLLVGSQHELLCKENTAKVVLDESKAHLAGPRGSSLRVHCSSTNNDAVLQKKKL